MKGGNEFVIQKVDTVDEGAFGATECRCSKVIQCRMVVIWGCLWFSGLAILAIPQSGLLLGNFREKVWTEEDVSHLIYSIVLV